MLGTAKLIFSPLAFLIYTPFSIVAFFLTVFVNLAKMSEFKMHWQQVKSSFFISTRRMVDGIAEIGLGLILGITSLLLPIKVVSNLILTKNSPERSIETNSGMVRLLNEADKANNDEASN